MRKLRTIDFGQNFTERSQADISVTLATIEFITRLRNFNNIFLRNKYIKKRKALNHEHQSAAKAKPAPHQKDKKKEIRK